MPQQHVDQELAQPQHIRDTQHCEARYHTRTGSQRQRRVQVQLVEPHPGEGPEGLSQPKAYHAELGLLEFRLGLGDALVLDEQLERMEQAQAEQ